MLRPALALSFVLALTAPAVASHCTTYSTTPAIVDSGVAPGAPRYYVDEDYLGCIDFCTFWVYQESNGIDGLQRRDEVVDDTCHDLVPGDTIIF